MKKATKQGRSALFCGPNRTQAAQAVQPNNRSSDSGLNWLAGFTGRNT